MTENTNPVPHETFYGQPEKPSGDTNLPQVPQIDSWDKFSRATQEQRDAYMAAHAAPVQDPNVPATPSPEMLAEIHKLPASQQEMLLAFFSTAWNKPSPHLDGRYVVTLAGLLMHAEGEMKHLRRKQREEETASRAGRREMRAQREQAHEVFAREHAEWQQECIRRNVWIKGKTDEWRRRIEERRQAVANWDAYVEEARKDMAAAKAVPPPPRPVKP